MYSSSNCTTSFGRTFRWWWVKTLVGIVGSNRRWVCCIWFKHTIVVMVHISFLCWVVLIKLWFYNPFQAISWPFECICHLYVDTFLFCKPCHLFHLFCQSKSLVAQAMSWAFFSSQQTLLWVPFFYTCQRSDIVSLIFFRLTLGQFLDHFPSLFTLYCLANWLIR